MRSKTSWFDKTIFLKDLTRFAPLMGLYALCLLAGAALMASNDGVSFFYARNVMECLHLVMPVVNLFYAPVVATLLFGDLCGSRMCNAIHALPLRRETLSFSHVAAGLCYSVLPGLLFTLVSLPMLVSTCFENAWILAPLWLAGCTLQFILFFGIAILCVFLTGNRAAMLMLYAFLNAFSYLVFFLVDSFYTPMLYGVITPDYLAIRLCPVALMTINGNAPAEFDNYSTLKEQFRGREAEMVAHFQLNGGAWTTLALCGLVGLALMALALILYRRRQLECAGDALAVKFLSPALPVLGGFLGLIVGRTALNILGISDSVGEVLCVVLLLLSLAVGWFAAEMFMARSTRVFRGRSFLGMGALVLCLAVSLVLTHFDVLRIDERIPDTQNIASITFWNGGEVTLEDPEEIETFRQLHRLILEDRMEGDGAGRVLDGMAEAGGFAYVYQVGDDDQAETMTLEELREEMTKLTWVPYRYATGLRVEYNLKNGRTLSRTYTFWSGSEAGDLLRSLTSTWERAVLQNFYPNRDIRDRLGDVNDAYTPTEEELMDVLRIRVRGQDLPKEALGNIQGLYDALKADCQEGHMSPSSTLHNGFFSIENIPCEESLYMDITLGAGTLDLQIYADCRHTIAWLRENGFDNFLVNHENVIPVTLEKESVDVVYQADTIAVR